MVLLTTVACGVFSPRTGQAQSSNDLAAFSALIVSPSGALAPIAVDNGQRQAEHTSLAIRFGAWRYDLDDAEHQNVALTYAHRIAGTRASVSLTGAYLVLACTCSAWTSGGVAVKTTLWNSNARHTTAPRTMHIAIDLASGGARYSGVGHATAYASSGVLDVGVGLATFKHTRLAVTVNPGIGYGRLQSTDASGHGFRTLLGASVSWRTPIGLALDVGMQRVVLAGGPTAYGGGLSWHSK